MTSSARFRTSIGLFAAALVLASCGSNPTPTPPSGALPSNSQAASASPEPSSSASASSPTPSPSPSPTPTPSPSPTPAIPAFSHIYVIVMENKEAYQIVRAKAAPYENSLISKYGLVLAMFAETHPSEPNYIALTSGGTQGTRTDGHYDLSAPNLFDQIEASGRTWHVYAQGYPGGCYTGSVARGVVDGPGYAGQYVRKHNPAISYRGISRNPARCANITHLAGFNPAAADFELIIPNQINDMHSSSVAAGDAFLKVFVPQIVNSPAFANSVLFITWDEGATSGYGGGHIATIVVSPGMKPGSTFAPHTTHFSLLRTIEDAWGMPRLGSAATASPLLFPYFG